MMVPVVIGGVTRWKEISDAEAGPRKPERKPLLREAFGVIIREHRTNSGRTLRQVSADARMALGYLSEVERGQKEPSSEVLSSLCAALDLPMTELLDKAGAIMRKYERPLVPDTIPAEMVNDVLSGTKS